MDIFILIKFHQFRGTKQALTVHVTDFAFLNDETLSNSMAFFMHSQYVKYCYILYYACIMHVLCMYNVHVYIAPPSTSYFQQFSPRQLCC